MDLSQLTRADWQALSDSVSADTPTGLYIDGEFVAAADDVRLETINPATGEPFQAFSAGAAVDIDRAVTVARQRFRDGVWARMAPRDRMAVMYRWAQLIAENCRDLAVLETLDMGKPIRVVIEEDLPGVVDYIQFCGECIDKIEGPSSISRGSRIISSRKARRSAGDIHPRTPARCTALAAGNSVVLKPAEQAPLSCLRLAQLFVEAGGPPGVFNVVNGLGEVAGKALALHTDVDKISFTGSTAVGKLMLQYAGKSNMKQVSLETGGKSPQIFLADLPDLDVAVEAAIYGIFSNQGEVCNAGSRLIVERAIYDDFVARFRERGREEFTVGDPLDPATTMGPLVTAEAQRRVLGYIDSGREEGASLEFGGGVPAGLEAGAFVEPTLFSEVHNSMTIAREEIFGPVAAVIPVADADEALAVANDTVYGLAASVWTADVAKAHRFIRDLEAGVVWVNTFDEADMTLPFGGFKQSGNAKDNCMQSVVSYTREKAAWINIAE